MVNAMVGSDDLLHYLWLVGKFNALVMKMAHLAANVIVINVFKYLPLHLAKEKVPPDHSKTLTRCVTRIDPYCVVRCVVVVSYRRDVRLAAVAQHGLRQAKNLSHGTTVGAREMTATAEPQGVSLKTSRKRCIFTAVPDLI